MCFAFRQVQSFSCSRIILIQTTFRIQEDIVYLSGCGAIPDDALFPVSGRQLPVRILECLNLRKPQHPSNFGLETAVAAARRIGAKRTYLLGFSHELRMTSTLREARRLAGLRSLGGRISRRMR